MSSENMLTAKQMQERSVEAQRKKWGKGYKAEMRRRSSLRKLSPSKAKKVLRKKSKKDTI